MRATPLAVWCQNLPSQQITKAVDQDVTLVHSNPLMVEVVATYCAAIQSLIQNHDVPERARNAFEAAEKFALS